MTLPPHDHCHCPFLLTLYQMKHSNSWQQLKHTCMTRISCLSLPKPPSSLALIQIDPHTTSWVIFLKSHQGWERLQWFLMSCLCEGKPGQCKSACMTLCLACCLSVLATHPLLSHKHLLEKHILFDLPLRPQTYSSISWIFISNSLLISLIAHYLFLITLGRINEPTLHVLAHLFVYLQHMKLQVTVVLPCLPRDSQLALPWWVPAMWQAFYL